MTTATREIRPFEISTRLEDFVAAIALRVDDAILESGGQIVLSEEDFLRCGVSIRLPGHKETFDEMLDDLRNDLALLDLAPSDLCLVVNLYSPFLKISEFPVVETMSSLRPERLELSVTDSGPRPSALQTAKSGCHVEVSIVLNREMPKRPLRPWRKNTWLARAQFTIATEGIFNGFTPRPLDKARKEEFGLPMGTTRYVIVPDSIDPLADEGSPEMVELWVDADLLALISASDQSLGSIAIQRQLFVDAFSAVLLAVRGQEQLETVSWPDIQTSMLGKMLAALAGKKSGETEVAVQRRCEVLLTLIKRDPGVFLAHVESFADCTNSYIKMIGA